MFKTSLLAVVLAASAAHAQGTDTGAAPAAPAGDAYQKGTLGFSFPITLLSNFSSELTGLTRAEPVPTVDVLYFLSDKAALDFIAGFNLHYEQVVDAMMMKSQTTVFGFAAGIGYRMYHHDGKLHRFLEPKGELFMGDTSRSPTFGIAVGVELGLEREIADWLALSGAIGGQVLATNSFNDLQVVPTADLSATFYFK